MLFDRLPGFQVLISILFVTRADDQRDMLGQLLLAARSDCEHPEQRKLVKRVQEQDQRCSALASPMRLLSSGTRSR
jgi:hypothetical protein